MNQWQKFNPDDQRTWPPFYKRVLVLTGSDLVVDFISESKNGFHSLDHQDTAKYWLIIPDLPAQEGA